MKKILVALFPVVLVASAIMGMETEEMRTKKIEKLFKKDKEKTDGDIKSTLEFAQYLSRSTEYESALFLAKGLAIQKYDKQIQWKAKILAGEIYTTQKKLDEARKILEQVANQKSFKKLSDKAKSNMYWLGDKYKNKGEIEKAMEMYEQASQQDKYKKQKYLALHSLGDIYVQKYDPVNAIKYYDKAINEEKHMEWNKYLAYTATEGKSILLHTIDRFEEEKVLLKKLMKQDINKPLQKRAKARLKKLKEEGLIK